VEIRTYVGKIQGKTRVLGIARDITKRKRDEEKLKALIKEKEILVKEVHHRVKNNFSVISSLLNLQSHKIKDKEAHNIFIQSRDRIQSMSLIHEKLYQSQDIGSIDFAEYIKTLAKKLYYSQIEDTAEIKLTTELENVSLGMDQAIPCGLIVNEILTNTMKYAFPKILVVKERSKLYCKRRKIRLN